MIHFFTDFEVHFCFARRFTFLGYVLFYNTRLWKMSKKNPKSQRLNQKVKKTLDFTKKVEKQNRHP